MFNEVLVDSKSRAKLQRSIIQGKRNLFGEIGSSRILLYLELDQGLFRRSHDEVLFGLQSFRVSTQITLTITRPGFL